MNTRSKKGYALAMSLIFVIVVTIIGFGLYASIEYFVKEVKLQETEYIKGHYAVLAGLRYAMIVLEDPEERFAFFGDVPPIDVGDSITISLWDDYNTVAVDMGLSDRLDVILVITKNTDDEFDVTATYTVE